MVAMRRYMRGKSVEKVSDASLLKGTHLTPAQVEEMYQVMAIANYEDRFVIPSSHKEMVENAFEDKASCGFSFGNGCSGGVSEPSLFGKKKATPIVFHDMRRDRKANAEGNPDA